MIPELFQLLRTIDLHTQRHPGRFPYSAEIGRFQVVLLKVPGILVASAAVRSETGEAWIKIAESKHTSSQAALSVLQQQLSTLKHQLAKIEDRYECRLCGKTARGVDEAFVVLSGDPPSSEKFNQLITLQIGEFCGSDGVQLPYGGSQ